MYRSKFQQGDEQIDPGLDEYNPFEQGSHDDAPDKDSVPTGQFKHTTDPAALYVPESQGRHFNQLLPIIVPARQGVQDDLSDEDSDPLGHLGQNDFPVELLK